MAEAFLVFGLDRSIFYRWQGRVERAGPDMLQPRDRREPRMPNHPILVIEERVLGLVNRPPRPEL